MVQPLVSGEFPKSVIETFEKTNENEKLRIRRLIPFNEDEKKDLIGNKYS